MHRINLGPNRQNFMSRSSATAHAGGVNPAGANSSTNTSGTQTTSSSNAANNSGTQTTNTATNSSGTQTGPRTSAFIMPGLPGALPGLGQGIPGLGAGIPGLGAGIPRIPGAPVPMDPFLQCSSRHFLQYRERNSQNQPQPGSTANNQVCVARITMLFSCTLNAYDRRH